MLPQLDKSSNRDGSMIVRLEESTVRTKTEKVNSGYLGELSECRSEDEAKTLSFIW